MEPTPEQIERLRNGLEAISTSSTSLTTWALAILAGSIATVISTDYLKPTGWMKRGYLLFLPGWILLGLSLYYGDQALSGHAASAFTQKWETLMDIGQNMNRDLGEQRFYLGGSLAVFALWLFGFLIWWVFHKPSASD